ncbi:hypothetical protein VIGAN_01308400 [Vigna angularis var. angularis]|uniref:Uncharacterized protein n=1 Tax=Vigna angularis var. angularis TaxID=157739 RepID=A0A0S3R3U1_PHAAN|nr:hypothetical protein VIGAN_01308400 [Vigna angularis var. angularis]
MQIPKHIFIPNFRDIFPPLKNNIKVTKNTQRNLLHIGHIIPEGPSSSVRGRTMYAYNIKDLPFIETMIEIYSQDNEKIVTQSYTSSIIQLTILRKSLSRRFIRMNLACP